MTEPQRAWGIHLDDDADSLEALVHSVYRELARRPANLADLKRAMIELLSYLTLPENRTDDNCRAVDAFFCIRHQWEANWNHLPP